MAVADIIRRGYANTIGTVTTRGYLGTSADTRGEVTLTLAIRDDVTLTLAIRDDVTLTLTGGS